MIQLSSEPPARLLDVNELVPLILEILPDLTIEPCKRRYQDRDYAAIALSMRGTRVNPGCVFMTTMAIVKDRVILSIHSVGENEVVMHRPLVGLKVKDLLLMVKAMWLPEGSAS